MSENVLERAFEALQDRYGADEGCGCGPEADGAQRESDGEDTAADTND